MTFVQSTLDCISRWQVEIVTCLLLVFGQLLVRLYYSQQRKYSKISSFEQNSAKDCSYDKRNNEKQILEFQQIDSQQKVKIMNKLIKLGKVDEAEKIVNQIENPHTYIYTIQMKGYTKKKDLTKAQCLISQMQNSENKPNLVTYNTYLTCAVKSQNLQEAKQIFDSMTEKDIITYSTYVRGLLKCKQADEAIRIHNEVINNQELTLDQMYFNILINGLIKNKKVDQAFDVYEQMRERNFEQNEYSITVLIQLFNKLSNQKFMDILKNFKSKDKQFYSQIVQSLFKNPQYVLKGIETLKNTMQRNIVLKKVVYEIAIQMLQKVISNQIILEGVSITDSQQTMYYILEFIKKKNIQVKNDLLIQLSNSSFYTIIQKQQLPVIFQIRNQGLLNRCD